MEPTNHLLNTGILSLGPPPSGEQRTIIVLGVGRGGTSLCSKALHTLGVFTGKESNPPIYEDIPLSRALEKHNFEEAKKLITEYNSKHNIWAFKRPTTNATIPQLHKLLRNPHYIIIFRDILAIAQRNNLSMGGNVLNTMNDALSDYSRILNFLNTNPAPALLVSYEKTLKEPKPFIESINNFCGIKESTSLQTIEAAINSIKPSPIDYLINTSAVNFFGYLDSATEERVSGWAAFDRTEKEVVLELFLNNEKLTEWTPSDFREDIRSKGLHPTGHCGYSLKYPNNKKAKRGDKVSIKFKETGIDLRNSPMEIQ